MNWLDWIGGWLNREAEFPFLERYIEEELRRATDIGLGAVGLLISFGVLGAFWMAGAFLESSGLMYAGPVAAIATGLVLLHQARQNVHPTQRELDKKRKSLRSFVHQLQSWRKMRMLRFKLPGGLGEILDVGARCWLQARYGLEPILNGPTRDPIYDTSVRVMRAMDAGMTKLLDVACDTAMSGMLLTPMYDGSRGVAEHMVALSREVDKISAKYETDREQQSVSATDELRAALAECRGLEEAHEELDSIHL